MLCNRFPAVNKFMVQNMRAVRVPSEFWRKISKQICSWSVDTDGNELSEVFKVFVRSGSQPVPSLTWYTELLIYYLANIFSCFSNTFKHFLLYLEGINNRFKENEKICGRDCGDSVSGIMVFGYSLVQYLCLKIIKIKTNLALA